MKRSEEQDEANRLAEKSRYSKEEMEARMMEKTQPMTTTKQPDMPDEIFLVEKHDEDHGKIITWVRDAAFYGGGVRYIRADPSNPVDSVAVGKVRELLKSIMERSGGNSFASWANASEALAILDALPQVVGGDVPTKLENIGISDKPAEVVGMSAPVTDEKRVAALKDMEAYTDGFEQVHPTALAQFCTKQFETIRACLLSTPTHVSQAAGDEVIKNGADALRWLLNKGNNFNAPKAQIGRLLYDHSQGDLSIIEHLENLWEALEKRAASQNTAQDRREVSEKDIFSIASQEVLRGELRGKHWIKILSPTEEYTLRNAIKAIRAKFVILGRG